MTIYIETPSGFSPWAGQAIDGKKLPYKSAQNWPAVALAAFGLYRPEPAALEPAGKRTTGMTVARVEGVVRHVRILEDRTLDEMKAMRLAELSDKRWREETGGISVGGLAVPSDRETQDRIDQVVKAYDDGDLVDTILFKRRNGEHFEIGEQALRAIKAAGAQHIQACFRREGELAALILAAEDAAALAAIDISAGWPG